MNQEESEHNEVDGMKKGVDSLINSLIDNSRRISKSKIINTLKKSM